MNSLMVHQWMWSPFFGSLSWGPSFGVGGWCAADPDQFADGLAKNGWRNKFKVHTYMLVRDLKFPRISGWGPTKRHGAQNKKHEEGSHFLKK